MNAFVKLAGRFARPDPKNLTAEQQKVVDEVMASRGSDRGRPYSFRGAFYPVLQNPELLSPMQKVGEYLRFKCHLSEDLVELAILISLRQCNCRYAWDGHAPNALKAGLPANVIQAVGENRRPAGMSPAVTAVHDFAIALHREKQVSDELFAAARGHVGEQGLLDVVAICGYYTMVGMVIAADRTPIPEGRSAPF